MKNNSIKHSKVLIIGSGPAGYTAAVYAARAMLKPILISGMEVGGQLSTTTDVENYPGFSKVIQGPWLMEQMKDQAKAVGTELITDHIASVNLKSKPFEVIGDGGQKYTGDSIIISTGAQARWLNLESEQKFRGFGVSACATCDGFFFKDKTVAVVVIGNKDPKNVTGLKIKNVKSNKVEELKIDGLFIAIGHDPATQLFKDQLKMDKEGYLITKPDSTQTNVPGVFAAGDVKDKVFRQAVTAAGMGCMAALEAEKHLSQN